MLTVTELLQELIRFDTTNPPGNETACIEFVRAQLEDAGCETTIYGKDPTRPNLVSRLAGGDAPPLLLQGHVDVVTTAGQAWTYPPFEGRLEDGHVWGRGALDMKAGVAMLVHAFLRAKRENVELPGDLVLVVLSDEEAGGDLGARYLVEEQPQLFAGMRYALGEFGGFTLHLGGKRFYPIQVAEKQICWLKATVRGPGGHGAMVNRGGTVARLGKLLSDLDRKRLPVHVTPVVREFVDRIAAEVPRKEATVLRSLLKPRLTDVALRLLGERGTSLEPMLRNTVNATIVRGGQKINVVPSEIELELDGRALPGFSPDALIAEVQAIVGEDVELELMPARPRPGGARSRPLRHARGGDPRARPGGDPGPAAPDRRHRWPLLLPGRRADLRLPADAAAGGVQVREVDPRGGRADPGRRARVRRRGGLARDPEVPLRILVIGGTKFLGRAVAEDALARGHELTLFNRGETNPDLFPEVEKLHGDRKRDLSLLAGRTWDAVIDPSGYIPADVRASAEQLRDAGRYVFVSSVSVYADFSTGPTESSPTAELG